MELQLNRLIFSKKGVNGILSVDGYTLCKTIELPWCNNMQGISCIPQGRYELAKRHSLHFGEHLILKNVPARELILIHPANDALTELRGCIAPVTSFNGVGNGNSSRQALSCIMRAVGPAFAAGEQVWIIITNTKNI